MDSEDNEKPKNGNWIRLKNVCEMRPEIGKFILDKYKEGCGYVTIVNLLERDFGYKVSHMSIKRHIQRVYDSAGDALENSVEAKDKSMDIYLDTVEQMKGLNKKLWVLIDQMEEEGNVKDLILVAQEIRKQVELQNKILGKLNTGTQINIGRGTDVNAITMAMMINQHLAKMEERGYIIIRNNLKKVDALKRFDDEIERIKDDAIDVTPKLESQDVETNGEIIEFENELKTSLKDKITIGELDGSEN